MILRNRKNEKIVSLCCNIFNAILNDPVAIFMDDALYLNDLERS